MAPNTELRETPTDNVRVLTESEINNISGGCEATPHYRLQDTLNAWAHIVVTQLGFGCTGDFCGYA